MYDDVLPVSSCSICGSLRTVSLDTYSSGSVDVPDSRRSSHDQSIREGVYSSTQHLPDLDEIVTDGGTSSEDDGDGATNDAATAAAIPFNTRDHP